jgi:hypothetical protein
VLDYSSLFVIQFCGAYQSAQGLCLFIPGVAGVFCVVCSAHLFVLSNDMQADLEPAEVADVVVVAAVRNGSKFSQCNVV